jgi:hypothetical protein
MPLTGAAAGEPTLWRRRQRRAPRQQIARVKRQEGFGHHQQPERGEHRSDEPD